MRIPRRVNRRWAAPVAALVAVLGVGAVPGLLPSAWASTPDLPVLTPAELLVKAHSAAIPALSGTIQVVSDLGLPSLSGLAGGRSSTLTDLATGTHEAQVWLDGPTHARIALPSTLAESDWVRNGTDLWSWDSTTQQAVHATVPLHDKTTAAAPESVPEPMGQTPQALAQKLLADITPSTEVTVRSPRYVAGRPVYELDLAPRSATSTVGDVIISVDADTGLPLDVRILAKGASSAAFELGFTHVTMAAPSASEFAFAPPPGATVVQAKGSGAMLVRGEGRRWRRSHDAAATPEQASASAPASVKTLGTSWNSIVVLSSTGPRQLESLLSGAMRVSSGRLVTTRLVNVLVLDDGRILAGAVTPAALEAAAAHL